MLRPLFAAIVAATLAVPATAWAQATVDARLAPGKAPMVIAHRSAAMGDAPENTLAWIAAAIDRGVDMVHLNPQLTRDNRYVLMHDSTLNRMTNVEAVFPIGPPGGPTREDRWGKDYVRDYTLEEIRSLRITAPSGETHSVPTLAEALDQTSGKTLVALGLKTYEVESLAAALEAPNTDHVLLFELYYSGTDQSKLTALAEATGLGVFGALFRSHNHLGDLDALHQQVGPALKAILGDQARMTPEFIARAKDLGLHISVSGWDGPEDYALLAQNDPGPWMAVINEGHSALTDQPALLLEALGR